MTDTTKNTAAPVNPASAELAIPLATPNGEVKTISFRRGKAKDMVAAQRIESDPARRELVLMAMLSEQKLTVEDIEELDLADLATVQAAFQSLWLPRASCRDLVGGVRAARQVVPLPAHGNLRAGVVGF